MKSKLLFVVNVDWFFVSHRLPIALKAIEQGYEVHLATQLTSYKKFIESKGIVVHSLSISRSDGNLLRLLSLFLHLLKLFYSVRPHLIHLVTIKPVLIGGIAARIMKAHGVVIAISGLGSTFIDNGFIGMIRKKLILLSYKLALKHKNLKIIFQNKDDHFSMNQVVSLKNNQVSFIKGSGVDLSEFKFAQLHFSNYVIMPSRLLKDKGVYEFVEAAKILKNLNSQIICVLVGSIDHGNPSSISKQEIDSWVNSNFIEYWGHSRDMSNILARADLVVLPSYREGFPKVLMEAAAKGRPVITSDVPGCRDAIDPNITGVLVPAKNSIILADAISDLMSNRELLIKMGKNGRRLAESNFSECDVSKHHMNIYAELINNNY